MTYCLGMLLDEGLIMMADTRTNAGVDNFSMYRKLHLLADGPDRMIYACTAGNLSVTQTVMTLIREGLPAEGPEGELRRSLKEAGTMFRAAQLVGEAIQVAGRTVAKALESLNISAGSAILLGGRIGNQPPALFLMYDAGNFIQCKPEVPFFQIGETKYGRPILDREVRTETPLADAVKCGFLSFDAAMASNLGVARPIDLMVMPTDRKRPILSRRVEQDDDYFNDVSKRWSDLLHAGTRAIPNPPFMG
ncbi:MAG TPA: peptidase [Allosphingosinicella sp.]